MEEITWILVIYLLGLAAMVVELFIPGAVIGISGFCAVVGTMIYAAATGQTTLALALLAVTLVFLPFFFLLWKNVLGKVFALPETLKDFRSSTGDYESLSGKVGVADSSLRPSGSAIVDGKRYTVVTRGEMLDKGVEIEVIDVAGTKLIVRRRRRQSSPE